MLSGCCIAQINVTVGDIEGNVARITEAYEEAVRQGAELVIFPELCVCGYPPEDLVLHPAFRQAVWQACETLANATASGTTDMIIGGIEERDGEIFNVALLLSEGRIRHIHRKTILPNYGVFDEKRVFTAGNTCAPIIWRGKKILLLNCEEIWFPPPLADTDIDLTIVINASPFTYEKLDRRLEVARRFQQQVDAPLIYVNLVGGQDDIIFDGGSFVLNNNGNIHQLWPFFAQSIALINNQASPASIPERTALIWQAVVMGLHDYVAKNGFNGVLLGLSGGIDSAVTAALAVDALGAERVMGVRLPSHLTSELSNDDAQALATALNIKLITVPILPAYEGMRTMLDPVIGSLNPVLHDWQDSLLVGGNIQSRLRGVTLMALSNATGHLLLNTSNKSEIAVGYSTLYGDSCGGYAPLKDIYKTDIYALAKWRNSVHKIIPESSITRPPTAELVEGQKDSDQLPDYAVLDGILACLIEQKASQKDLIAKGYDAPTVERITHLLRISEYKRRQSPPGAKISPMLFSRNRRYPLTNKWSG